MYVGQPQYQGLATIMKTENQIIKRTGGGWDFFKGLKHMYVRTLLKHFTQMAHSMGRRFTPFDKKGAFHKLKREENVMKYKTRRGRLHR